MGELIAAGAARRRGVDWADCPAGWGLAPPVLCGWVTVPVDYAHPFGATIRLAVDRAAATGAARQRQGALVYNPGGPGGSGLRFPLRSTTGAALWTRTAAAYDFVGFDPRGVGHSAPISCQDPGEYAKAPKADPVPDGEADKLAHRALARAYADGCLERTGADMLAQMTTPDTARDLDVIRAGLGERRLNYLGASYGTYLGAVYATLFPTHVRRLIVDSVVDPARDGIWYRDNLDQDAAFESRWQDWESWVASYDSAYHLGATTAQVQVKWRQLRAAAKAHPIGGVVGPSELLAFFQNAPYYDSSWAVVAGAWSRYAAGDTRALVDAAGPAADGTAGDAAAENGTAVYTAVECADAAWPGDVEHLGPRQHRAQHAVPLPDLVQHLAEPALRDLARAAPHPGGRPLAPRTARRAHRAERPRRGDAVRRSARTAPQAGRVATGHRAGRRFARRHRPGQPLRQLPCRRLPVGRHARRARRGVRAPRGARPPEPVPGTEPVSLPVPPKR